MPSKKSKNKKKVLPKRAISPGFDSINGSEIINLNVMSQFQEAIRKSMKMGGAAMQIIKLIENNQKNSLEKRFGQWKIDYLNGREGIQIIT